MASEGNEEEVWLSSAEAARLLVVARHTITRWAREGRLPHRRTAAGRYLLASLAS